MRSSKSQELARTGRDGRILVLRRRTVREASKRLDMPPRRARTLPEVADTGARRCCGVSEPTPWDQCGDVSGRVTNTGKIVSLDPDMPIPVLGRWAILSQSSEYSRPVRVVISVFAGDGVTIAVSLALGNGLREAHTARASGCELVAHGHSNRQIAATHALSANTVACTEHD